MNAIDTAKLSADYDREGLVLVREFLTAGEVADVRAELAEVEAAGEALSLRRRHAEAGVSARPHPGGENGRAGSGTGGLSLGVAAGPRGPGGDRGKQAPAKKRGVPGGRVLLPC